MEDDIGDATTAGPGKTAWRAVVVGGSAGGVEALQTALAELPASFPLPIVVVVHLAPGTVAPWASVFSGCPLPVREAEDRDLAEPGIIAIAPPDYHLLVDRGGRLALSTDAPVLFSRPSIDVLFDSAAWAWGSGVLGIVLSGANADGADGLRAIRCAGGGCWVQDPATALTSLMPRAAIEAVPDARVLAPAAIGRALAELGRRAVDREATTAQTRKTSYA